MKDVIVVGAGIAGLSAAWRLRHRNVMVLEADHRVGGRVRSERRGPYWLNWGGHVYAGAGSATQSLVDSVGVQSAPVLGLLKGLHINGKLYLDGKLETTPFRAPMSFQSRIALITKGVKIRYAVHKYAKMVAKRPGEDHRVHQQRVYDFMNDQTFSEWIGPLPEDTDALFRPTISRCAGTPEQVATGAGVGYFNLVLTKGDGGGLSQYICGGASNLTETITAALGERVHLGAKVDEVVHEKNGVIVRYTKDGVSYEEKARYVVLATQAPITREIAKDIDPKTREALDIIKYGPWLSAAFLTNETTPQVWDNTYAIATPKRSFYVAFNMSNAVRNHEPFRQQGSSIMTFSPAETAQRLINKTEPEILDILLRDLDEMFPGFSKTVVESQVDRWKLGGPYCFPGRAKLQPFLTRPLGRIYLAGDYLGTFYTETAIQTGQTAAMDILSHLGTESLKTVADKKPRDAEKKQKQTKEISCHN